MKKWIAMLMLLTLLPIPTLAELDPVVHTLETRAVPVYCAKMREDRDVADMILLPEFSLYYADGVPDLPYVDLSEFVGLVNQVDTFDAREASGNQEESREDYVSKADWEQGLFTCTYQPQESNLIFDFHRGILTYSCMDTFGRDPAYSPFELQTNQLDFLQRRYDPKMNRLGGEKTLSLSQYGIPMLMQDGKMLLPLHTAFDFLMWVPKVPWKILCCNGTAIFIGGYDSMFGYTDALSELGKLYFSQQPTRRSPELAQYGYHELCLMLDSFYGLKETHHIDSFDSFLRSNGYEARLTSEDPKEADQALNDLIAFALDDFHSVYSFPSWMSGSDQEVEEQNGETPVSFSFGLYSKAGKAFEEALQIDHPFYYESGNTAYVLIRSMTTSIDSEQYYALDLENKNQIDTLDAVQEILYADRQINRENSPIENVVLDLSLNPGGDVNAAACVLSWFLGDGYVTMANSFTHGLGIGLYKADINRDHQFTEADSLLGKKKLFCLISPITFSSANMTAAMLKSSGVVTLIGQTSRGGSGLRTNAVSGWDSIFVLSGFRTVVTVKNGSWFDADVGVLPDVYLSDASLFYDREKLTEVINALR